MRFYGMPYPEAPDAKAIVTGNDLHPYLYGVVLFYQTPLGTLIIAQFQGLPSDTENGIERFLGFHIHENGNCSQNEAYEFNLTGNHYNPDNKPHPNHRGDLPPILNCNGFAWQSFLTNEFEITDVIGKSVVVHSMHDDFMTQPSGNSGAKIGCGVIRPNN